MNPSDIIFFKILLGVIATLVVMLGVSELVSHYRNKRKINIPSRKTMKEFELVQVHELGSIAEVVIRDKNGELVYAGNLHKQRNPKAYYPAQEKRSDEAKTTLVDGSPVTSDHREIQSNGQQKAYVVLSEEERSKGFVRPLRRRYIHVGKPICAKIRKSRVQRLGGARFICTLQDKHDEECGEWKSVSQPEGEEAKRTHTLVPVSCGELTMIKGSIAETYARDPKFYNETFCVSCRAYFLVEEFVWNDTNERVGS